MNSSTRRSFLNLSGGAAAGAAVAGCSDREAKPEDNDEPMPAKNNETAWIDAHVHVWTPDTDNWPLAEGFARDRMNPPSFTPEELFAQCRPHDVTRIVLIQMSYYGFDNSYMLDAMKRHPGAFGGVAVIDHEAPDPGKTMKELAAQGVRGFRLRASRENAETWQDSAGMKKMWQTGAEEGLWMCCLSNADALPAIRGMCEKFPKTPVVIDHFSRIGVSGTIERTDLDNLLKLADHEMVHVKTSAFYALGKKAAPYTDLGPMIRELRDAYGAERLMWATDCPFQVQNGHTYGDSIALVRDRLDFLTDDDKEWMLRKTAEKVFFA